MVRDVSFASSRLWRFKRLRGCSMITVEIAKKKIAEKEHAFSFFLVLREKRLERVMLL